MGWCEISTQRMQDMAAQPGSVVELQPPKGRSQGNYGTLQVGGSYLGGLGGLQTPYCV